MGKPEGIKALGKDRYEILVWYTCPRTGAQRKARRRINAKSRADAKRKREELRAEKQRIGAQRTERPRFGPAATSWLSSKLATWKKSTRTNHASILDTHIMPAFADFYVDAIAADDVVAWRDRQTGSPSSVNSRLRLLRQVMRDVCRMLGVTSPAEAVRFVREPLDEERAVRYLDPGEARAVLEWLRVNQPRRYPLVAALALTGARFGEITALRWTDIEDEWIRIRRAQWKGVIDHPKSKVGRRDLPLTPELAAILREHRSATQARATKRAERRGDAVALETGYVFTGNTGALHHNSVMTKPVRAALTACGITGRFPAAHGWRKVYNNILRRVTDETVRQALIGHSDAQVGREHYSEATREEMRRASATVVRLVTGGGS